MMKQDEQHEESPRQPKPPVRGRVLRILRRTFAVLLLLLLLIGGCTQTEFFRNFLSSKVTSFVEDNTNATIAIGSIGGNFLTGISLNNVRLKLKNDSTTILAARSVSVRFSLWQIIFSNKFSVNDLSLDAPSINLKKSFGDSVWNFQKLIRPSAPSSEASKPFSLAISLEQLSISNGSLHVFDANDTSVVQLMPGGKQQFIKWSNLDLEHLSLSASGSVQGENRQYIKLDQASFDEMNSPFHLYELSFTAYRDGSDVEVQDLRLLTNGTRLSLNASLSPLAVLSGKPLDSLRTSKTSMKLSADHVSNAELAQCLPQLSFLGGSPGIEFEADGEFGNLKIRKGRLDFGSDGWVSFTGNIRNLHQPDKLYLDVNLAARGLSDRTLRNYLPGLGLPDLARYETVDIPKLTFTGTPQNFSSEFRVETNHGNAEGKASLDLTKKQPVYTADLVTESLNLAPLANDSSLSSNLNIHLHAGGSGFDPKTMTAQAALDATSASSIFGFDIAELHLPVSVSKKMIETDESRVVFSDNSRIESNYLMLDLNGATPSYEADLTATGIPLARFVPAFPANSTASITATVSGNTSSLKTIAGSIHSVIDGLTYHGTTLAPIEAAMSLERNDTTGERTDVLSSDIADLTIKGIYDLKTLGLSLADRFTALTHSFDRSHRDSSIAFKKNLSEIVCSDSLECNYMLHMKDLRALDHFLPGITLLGKGRLKGIIEGCPDHAMSVSIAGTLAHFLIAPNDSSASPAHTPKIVARSVALDLALRNLDIHSTDILRDTRGHISLSSDSVFQTAGLDITKPNIQIKFANDRLRYSLGGGIEGKTKISVAGEGEIEATQKTFSLDTVRVVFSDGFEWTNDRSATASVNNNGIVTLDTLSLTRATANDQTNRFAQRLKLGFELASDSIRSAYISSPLLLVSDIPRFFSTWIDTSNMNMTTGRLTQLDAHLSGTLSRPIARAGFSMRNVSYNSVTVDTAGVSIEYRNGIIRGAVNVHIDSDAYRIGSLANGKEVIVPSASNILHIGIDSIPFLLSFADYPERSSDSARLAQSPFSVRVQMKQYPIDMFSPFIPVIADLHGLSDVQIGVFGKPGAITYKGEADISNGSFLVPYTNIRYHFSGPIRLSNDGLQFDNVQIENLPADLDGGVGFLNGGFHFNGFTLDKIQLTLAVPKQLLVLSDDSKQTMKSIYGPVIIRTGQNPLSFYGTPTEPHFDGDLTISQAYLTLPETVSSSAQLQSDGIRYITAAVASQKNDSVIVVRDSAHIRRILLRDEEEEAFVAAASTPSSAPVVQTLSSTDAPDDQSAASQSSFMDQLLYNLRINIPGDFWLNISFSQFLVPEQLKAELNSDGPLSFTRDKAGAHYSFFGRLNVTSRSSYKFIQEFSPVTGSIDFNKSPDNPSLDLSAEYIRAHQGGDVKIGINVDGTRYDPRITFELYRKNQTGGFDKDTRPQDQIQNDALFFLAMGMFPNESGASNAVASLGNNNAYSLGSQLASSLLNNALASTSLKNVVRSVGFEYGAAGSKGNATLGIGGLTITAGAGPNSYGTYGADFTGSGQIGPLTGEVEGHFNDQSTTTLWQQPILLGRLLYPLSIGK